MAIPSISVIIPTRNRAPLLRRALLSLTHQTFPEQQFEVLVVDNGSSDETQAVCDEFASRLPGFQCLFDGMPGLHRGRHAGLRASKAPILTFADDDIEAFDSWLEGVWESFQNGIVGLVGGKNLPKWETRPPHWVWELWHSDQVPWGQRMGTLSLIDFGDEVKEIDPYYVYGCNFSVRRELLVEAGGFHPDGMPQEQIAFRGDGESYISGFIQSRGLRTLYHPKASVYHHVPADRMTEDYFQKRAFNQGISDSFHEIRNLGRVPEQRPESLIQKLRRKALDHLFRRDVAGVQEELSKSELERAVNRSYRRGVLYHRRCCRRDPDLLDWVLKASYLD